MPRKLKITLWVAIGLLAAFLGIFMVGFARAMSGRAYSPFEVTVIGIVGLLFACGVLIVYWTQKTITQVELKSYLLLAGASAMGILFFGVMVIGLHRISPEAGFVMALIICPIALVVGAVFALRFKSTPAS